MRNFYRLAILLVCFFMVNNSSAQTCKATINADKPSYCPNSKATLSAFLNTSGDSGLTSLFAQNNYQKGNMFNIVAKEDVVVTGFDVNRDAANSAMVVYYRNGAFEGHERDSSKWTAIARTRKFSGLGVDTATPLPLKFAIKVSKGDTVSFYVSTTDYSSPLYYTNGTSQGSIHSQDASIAFLEGVAVDWPFSGSSTGMIYTPRVWNGIIHYYRVTDLKFQWNTSDTTSRITVPVTGKQQYIVKVTKGGCSSIDTIEIDVAEKVSFSLGNDTSFCEGTSLQLDAGKWTGAKFKWKPGNSSGRYKLINGTSTVSAVMTSQNNCLYYDTVEVTMIDAPDVNLGKDLSLCMGDSAELDAGSFTGVGYTWSTNETTQKIIVKNGGRYIVTVLDNTTGCSAKDNLDVTLVLKPKVDLGKDIEVCEGTRITLKNANDNSLLSYVWSNSATTSTIDIQSSGTYSVSVSDTNGCTGADTVVAFFHDNPVINLGTDRETCKGDIVKLDAGMHGPKTTWSWNTSETTQMIDALKSGEYSVVVVDSFGCTSTAVVNLEFRKLPFVDLGGRLDFCDGDSAKLDAGYDDGQTQYSWSTGATSKEIYAKATGNYQVTVTDSFGCKSTDETDITVFDIPVLKLGNDTSICKGTKLTLDAGVHTKYRWSNDEKTQTISVGEGTYSVLVSNAFGCENTDEIKVTEADVPVALFSGKDIGGQTAEFTNKSTDGDSFEWDFGDDSPTSDEESPKHWYEEEGSYTVTLKVTNKCGTTSHSEVVAVVKSGIQIPGEVAIAIYPNPTSGHFMIDLTTLVNMNSSRIRIHNLAGKEFFITSSNTQNGIYEVKLPDDITKGLYIVSISADEQTYYTKLIVE